MHAVKYGTGKNIVIGIHGWSGDQSTYEPLLKYLPEDTTFISIDLPGCGKSPPPKDWKLIEVIEELANWMSQLNEPEITIIGNCSGGLLALELTHHLLTKCQSRMVKRLVIIDPYAYFPWYFKVFVSPKIGDIGWYAYYTTFANPIGRWLTNLSLTRHRTEETDLTNSFSDVNHRATYNYLKFLTEISEAGKYKIINIPVEIVYGENTFGAVRKSLSIWKKVFPINRTFELKDTGHLPIQENTFGLARILFELN